MVNTERKSDPGNPVEDEINSNGDTEKPETSALPVPEQRYAQRKSCDSTYKSPAPIGDRITKDESNR